MSRGPTPAMKQFYDIKARYPDTILFFQMGDFFETFGEDARVVSSELGIVLTSRGKDEHGEKMPLAGVPLHAGESYMSRLVRKGYRVAVCEQVEDAKLAKGVVKRDVVRVITPGTVIDPSMIDSDVARYLMALAPYRTRAHGLAFLDITTGEFFVVSAGDVPSEVIRYRPGECIVPSDAPRQVVEDLEALGVVVTRFSAEAFTPAAARSLLQSQFGVTSLEGYGLDADDEKIAAAGAALAYARETQQSELPHITGLSYRSSADGMMLDATTLRNLEIATSIRGTKDGFTLLGVLDATVTPGGSRTLHSIAIRPLTTREEIEKRLDAVEFFVGNMQARTEIRELLGKSGDIERITGRISYGNASPRDLISLRKTLELVPGIHGVLERGVPRLLEERLQTLHGFPELADLIGRAIVDDPPVSAKHGDVIRTGYRRTLDELREAARSGKDWISEFREKERTRTGIRSLKIRYNKVFGYYIEVTKANLHLVPDDYIRKQTTANGERYTIPDLNEKEAQIAHAEERMAALEQEIYDDIIKSLQPHISGLQETGRSIGWLDVFAALADAAVANRYVRPVIGDDERIVIREGRHPVVEHHLSGGFVPNDTEIGTEQNQILILTGANMAGKSTYMRSVALTCIMAQMGSFVPAAYADIGLVDRVFTRVGAFDDLASGQSTFMVEMLEVANILNNVTRKSLVILDEIGRGTSTLDGYSIASAVLEFLHGKRKAGPRSLFATHYHDLVAVEGALKRVKNYHFAVKDTGDDVVFLRKLIPGATDRSYGIHVARIAGIPPAVIDRATAILGETARRPVDASGRTATYTQMLLVDTPADASRPHPAIREIRDLDPDAMTPRQALDALYRLKRLAGGGESK